MPNPGTAKQGVRGAAVHVAAYKVQWKISDNDEDESTNESSENARERYRPNTENETWLLYYLILVTGKQKVVSCIGIFRYIQSIIKSNVELFVRP